MVEDIDVIVQDHTSKSNVSEKKKPLVRVRSIVSFVTDILNKYDKLSLLVQKESIPSDEIWLKVGGDHGGGSFKLCIQILNLQHPNSKHNTFVIALLEEKDTSENLVRLLGPNSHLQQDIRQLESLVWNGKKIRLFLSGDYDFLCKTHGLSGAQGVRPCLWCTITKDKIKKGEGPAQERTLVALKSDFLHFEKDGKGKRANAKHFNNVCSQPLWAIELSHVCPPYLHILLGITQKHHALLEDLSHDLDISIAKDLAQKRKTVDRSTKFGIYVRQLQERRALRSEERQIRDTLKDSACSSTYCKQATGVLKDIEKRQQKLKKECVLEDRTGPVTSSLDTVLKKHKITLQAYHGRSFVGNHAHKYFQEETIKDLCDNVASVCSEVTDNKNIIQEAEKISQVFETLNKLYSTVHSQISNDAFIKEDKINSFNKSIAKYMRYFRETFPDESITPKQHMLECHVVPWIKRFKHGMALHGEQGIEQSHAALNALKGRTRGIRNEHLRLTVLLKEHFLSVDPTLRLNR